MKETSRKLNPQTCESLPNATFSQGSGDGASPSDLRDGQTTDQSGQEAHHVSHLALQGKAKELRTTDISPQSGSISSKSADLQSYLASKLQQRLPRTDGWTLYKMHWKMKATPQGRQYCQLVASTPRTSVSDSGSREGWRTPIQSDGEGGVKDIVELKKTDKQPKIKLRDQAAVAGWPTPQARDYKGAQGRAKDGVLDTPAAALMAGWPTPQVFDTLPPKTGEALERNKKKGGCSNLREYVHMAGWVTPNSRDWKDTSGQTTKRKDGRSRIDQLPRQAYQIELTQPMRQKPNGEVLTGSGAEMESGGQLNPAHSRWLMGYPPEWDDCGVTAMPSSRKSQRKSSK